MTTATLNLGRVQKKIQTKIRAIDIPVVDWKSVCFMGFFMGLMLLVFYVWQIGNLTRDNYVLDGYKAQVSKLSDENKNLQISFAENSFMEEALIKIEGLKFQKAESVKYVNMSAGIAQTALAGK
jgi:hypothetical protein